MRAGAIPPLLDLLECGVFEVAEQAVWAIGNIAGDNDDYRKMILELDGFSRIIEFATKNQGIRVPYGTACGAFPICVGTSSGLKACSATSGPTSNSSAS